MSNPARITLIRGGETALVDRAVADAVRSIRTGSAQTAHADRIVVAAGDEDAVDALLPGAGLGLDDGVALLVHFRSILRHTRADRFWLLATWGRAL